MLRALKVLPEFKVQLALREQSELLAQPGHKALKGPKEQQGPKDLKDRPV